MTNVVILAAGFGTRLSKAGLNLPKGLIPYGDSTILGELIEDLLSTNSFKKIVIVSNNKFHNQYKKWLKKQNYAKKISLTNDKVDEPEKRLGAIGDLLFAIQKLKINSDVLVLPSDTLYNFKIKQFTDFAKKQNCFSTAFRYVKDKNIIKNRYGCAEVKNDKVISFEEKPENPKGHYLAVPFYFYPKKTLRLLEKYKDGGGNLDAPGSIISWFIKQNIPVGGFITNGNTLDVGTSKELKILRDNKFN